MLFGIDRLYLQWTEVDCYDNAIEYLDDNGEQRVLQGKKKETSVRTMTTMQEKRNRRKRCVLFAIHISSDKGKEVKDADVLSRYPALQHFQDVFRHIYQTFLLSWYQGKHQHQSHLTG